MSRTLIMTAVAAGVSVIAVLIAIAAKREARTGSGSNVQIDTARGSASGDNGSVVIAVLVDLSKSFVPGRGAGLLDEDQRAMRNVAEQLVLLAGEYRTVKILWFPILASAPTDVLCNPVEVHTSLVKRDGSVSREDVDDKVKGCITHIIAESKNDAHLASHTHISGAVSRAIASMEGYSARVLIILSDFKEDLAKGSKAASFQLRDTRVIMLHRPASDEPLNVRGYLDRVNLWKAKLSNGNTSGVIQMPLFSVSEARLRAALRPQDDQPRTSLTMLVDLKDDVFPRNSAGLADPAKLVEFGGDIAKLAARWPPPVTSQWVVVAGSGFRLQTEDPLEFWPKLIKPPDLLTEVPNFGAALEETAKRLPSFGRQVTTTDLSGTIDLVASEEPVPRSHVLVIVSNFVDALALSTKFRFMPGTRVMMLYRPTQADGQDPDAGSARLESWVKRFESSGASKVCKLPLATWVLGDLEQCLADRN